MAGSTHPYPDQPSPWVLRFAALIPPRGSLLDVTCGGGRHTRHFVERGNRVTTVDRDVSGVQDLAGRAEIVQADLEDGSPWPLQGRSFDAVLVTNYLWRPLFPQLLAWLAPGGVLLYETFSRGNERYGRPRNPEHMLAPGELLDVVRGQLRVVAYEEGIIAKPAVVARLCAVKGDDPLELPPG
jgi:SAM-dependent methyltransferase